VDVDAADTPTTTIVNPVGSEPNIFRAVTFGQVGVFMSITFQKRQKEMKRQEKQREKAEKRAQKRVTRSAAKDPTRTGQFTTAVNSSEYEGTDSSSAPLNPVPTHTEGR
jgi:hypothetical protein